VIQSRSTAPMAAPLAAPAPALGSGGSSLMRHAGTGPPVLRCTQTISQLRKLL
jgi:hypothetical protein